MYDYNQQFSKHFRKRITSVMGDVWWMSTGARIHKNMRCHTEMTKPKTEQQIDWTRCEEILRRALLKSGTPGGASRASVLFIGRAKGTQPNSRRT